MGIGWIAQTSSHMLSPQGRCFTFDQSANGQNRGEGCSCVNLQTSEPWQQDAMDAKGRLAMVAGTASNQDGKSASLTAPSGPAQQQLHRHSLRQAQVETVEISFGECHG